MEKGKKGSVKTKYQSHNTKDSPGIELESKEKYKQLVEEQKMTESSGEQIIFKNNLGAAQSQLPPS